MVELNMPYHSSAMLIFSCVNASSYFRNTKDKTKTYEQRSNEIMPNARPDLTSVNNHISSSSCL